VQTSTPTPVFSERLVGASLAEKQLLNVAQTVIRDYGVTYSIRQTPYAFKLDETMYQVYLTPVSTRLDLHLMKVNDWQKFLQWQELSSDQRAHFFRKISGRGWDGLRGGERRWLLQYFSPFTTQDKLNLQYTDLRFLSFWTGLTPDKLRAARQSVDLLNGPDRRKLLAKTMTKISPKEPIFLTIRSDATSLRALFDPVRRVVLALYDL